MVGFESVFYGGGFLFVIGYKFVRNVMENQVMQYMINLAELVFDRTKILSVDLHKDFPKIRLMSSCTYYDTF